MVKSNDSVPSLKKLLEISLKRVSIKEITDLFLSLPRKDLIRMVKDQEESLKIYLCNLFERTSGIKRKTLKDVILILAPYFSIDTIIKLFDCVLHQEDFHNSIEFLKAMLYSKSLKELDEYIKKLKENEEGRILLAKILPALPAFFPRERIKEIAEFLATNLPKRAYKWYIRSIAEIADFIGRDYTLRNLSRVLISDKKWIISYADVLLAITVGAYKLSLMHKDLREKIICLLKSILEEEKVQKMLLKGAAKTFDPLEAVAAFWVIKRIGEPEKYANYCISSILRAVKIHGDKVLVEAADLLGHLAKDKNGLGLRILRRLAKSKNYKIRELAAIVAVKLVKEKPDYLELLWFLCRDKRSSVRKIAASGVLDVLENLEGETYKKSIIALLASRRASAIRSALLSLLNRRGHVDADFVKDILERVIADPRSAVQKSIIEVLNVYWTEIPVEELAKLLKKILELSKNRKEIIDSAFILIESIIHELAHANRCDDLSILRKRLLSAREIPFSLKKRLVRSLEKKL